jgi:hypothetical protein
MSRLRKINSLNEQKGIGSALLDAFHENLTKRKA